VRPWRERHQGSDRGSEDRAAGVPRSIDPRGRLSAA
jgi:hypothetical protein